MYVPYEGPFPYAVPAELAGTCKRAVVENTVTGTRRWELQEFEGERPMLALYNDEGSKFFSWLWFFLSVLRARGAWLREPCHRGYRDWNLAIDECGWRTIVREGLLILNYKFAPFMSENFFNELRGALDRYLKIASPRDPPFQNLYPQIARDMGDILAATYGSMEHMSSVCLTLPEDKALQTKGDINTMKTFFQWVKSMKAFLPSWHKSLLTDQLRA